MISPASQCDGRTQDFDSCGEGSTPSEATGSGMLPMIDNYPEAVPPAELKADTGAASIFSHGTSA